MPQRVTGESPRFGQVAEDRSQESAQATVFISVSLQKARQGRVNSLGLAGLNDFRGPIHTQVVSSYLVPGSRMIKTKEYCLLRCMS